MVKDLVRNSTNRPPAGLERRGQRPILLPYGIRRRLAVRGSCLNLGWILNRYITSSPPEALAHPDFLPSIEAA